MAKKEMTLTKENAPTLTLADGLTAQLQMDSRHFSNGWIGMAYAVCEAKLEDSETKRVVGAVTGRMGGGVEVKIYDGDTEEKSATFFISPVELYGLVKRKYDEQYPAIIEKMEAAHG